MSDKKARISIEVDPSSAKKGRDDFLKMMKDMTVKVSQHLRTVQETFNSVSGSIDSRTRGTINRSLNMAIKKMDMMSKATKDMKKSEQEWAREAAKSGNATGNLSIKINNFTRHIHNNTKAVKDNTRGWNNWLTRSRNTRKAIGDFINYFRRLLGVLTLVTSASMSFAGTPILNGIVDAGKTFEKFEATLYAITGSEKETNAEMIKLIDSAKRYGVELTALGNSYIKLKAAAEQSDLGAEGADSIFTAMNITGRALNLTSEEVRGSLYALQQMISKSTVSMEELRLQLGERLPGALGHAAESMDLTVDRFKNLVESGKLSSDIFLPLFSSRLITQFFDGAVKSSQTLEAKLGRLKATVTELLAEMSKQGIFDAFKRGIDTITYFIENNGDLLKDIAKQFGNFFANGVTMLQSLSTESIQSSIISLARIVLTMAETFKEMVFWAAEFFDVDTSKIEQRLMNLRVMMADPGDVASLSANAGPLEIEVFNNMLDQREALLRDHISNIEGQMDKLRDGGYEDLGFFEQFNPMSQVKNQMMATASINELRAQREELLLEVGLITQARINASNQINGLANVGLEALNANTELLLDKYDTARKLLQTTKDELQGVNNIGKSLMQNRSEYTDALGRERKAQAMLDAGGLDPKAHNDAARMRLAAVEAQRQALINMNKYQEKVNNALDQFRAKMDKATESAMTYAETTSHLFNEEDRLARQMKTLGASYVNVQEAARQLRRKGINPNNVKEYREALDALNKALAVTATAFNKAYKEAEWFRQNIGGGEDYFNDLKTMISDMDNYTAGNITGISDQIKKIQDAAKLSRQSDSPISYAQEQEAIQVALKDTFGSTKLLSKEMRSLNMLYANGYIDLAQYNKELRRMKIEMYETQTDAASGFERALLKLQDQSADFASQTETMVVNAFQGMEDALVKFVETGKLSFSDLATQVMADITRMAIRYQMLQMMGMGGGMQDPVASLGGAIMGMFGGAGGGGIDVGSATAGQYASHAANFFPKFATGGEFVVGGTGGIDSQLVAMRVTPGEKVKVQTPVQQATDSDDGGNGSPTIIFNIQTPDADSFRRSEGQLYARAQTAISRAGRRNN